jgi:hypothetical protein
MGSIKGNKTAQVLADQGPAWYVCHREHPVAPSTSSDLEVELGHVLEKIFGNVHAYLSIALV